MKAFIIGNGPSRFALTPEEREAIERHTVITSNVAAFEYNSDYAIVSDRRVLDRWPFAWFAIDAFAEIVFPQIAEIDPTMPDFVQQVPASRDWKWTESINDGLLLYSNTGLSALHFAYLMGADPIYLVGFDMNDTGDGRTSNPQGMYPDDWRTNAPSVYKSMREAFEKYAPNLKGRRVVNLNPSSALRCFEFGDLSEAVK